MKRKSKKHKRKSVTSPIFQYQKRKRAKSHVLLWSLGLLIIVAAYLRFTNAFGLGQAPKRPTVSVAPLTRQAPGPQPGDLVSVDSVQYYSTAQTLALAEENYGKSTLPVDTGITKITFHYHSETPSGQLITEVARAYLPDAPDSNLPIFGFAPGTTGIGSECAPSVENVAKANWGNYDSHMAMYASQGFAAVTTDYEGMLEPPYIEHYMVGELEGRAVLDSIRALEQLPEAKGRLNESDVFLSGYSQGGHAAFWADKIAASYASSIKPLGVVGWGPVMSVSETMTDVIHGANINWFGPYVLYSYMDYYKHTYGDVLLPHWMATLDHDVPAHCIDSDIEYWGTKPALVYTPQFLAAAQNGTLASSYPQLWQDTLANAVGADPTPSAKLINSGTMDNVVLPQQQITAARQLCASSSGPVQLTIWPGVTHYDDMVHSLPSVLSWMHTLMVGGQVASDCNNLTAQLPATTTTPTPSPSPSLIP